MEMGEQETNWREAHPTPQGTSGSGNRCYFLTGHFLPKKVEIDVKSVVSRYVV
jgi:hypothetical protein